MGYYSDVAICMEKSAYDYIEEHYDKDKVYLLDYADVDNFGEEVVLFWNCVKWYDSSDDVKEVLAIFDKLSELGYQWYMLEVGEELGDVVYTASENFNGGLDHCPRVVMDW